MVQNRWKRNVQMKEVLQSKWTLGKEQVKWDEATGVQVKHPLPDNHCFPMLPASDRGPVDRSVHEYCRSAHRQSYRKSHGSGSHKHLRQ